MHNGRGCPGAQNRLIHPSLPHLLPSCSPGILLGLDVVKTPINPNVMWLCCLQGSRYQDEGGSFHFFLFSVGEWMRRAVPTQTSWEAVGTWNAGMAQDPLCPVPQEHFKSSA